MKKVVTGWVLLLIGAFLLTASLMMWFWAPSKAERTPLNSFSNTYLSGQVSVLDPKTGKVGTTPVWIFSQTKTDPNKSDGKVIVFTNTTCVNKDVGLGSKRCLSSKDARMITDDVDVFATDRHTAVAVNGRKYLPASAVEHHGLINKWPFNTQKQTYLYWDSMLAKVTPVKYLGTENILGLETYKFQQNVPPTSTQVATDIEGKYSIQQTFWIEPKTGAIIKQDQHQIRTLSDGSTLLDLQAVYTPGTVKANVDSANNNLKTLNLLRGPVPIIVGILGIALIVLGIFLVVRGRRTPGQAEEYDEAPADATAT